MRTGAAMEDGEQQIKEQLGNRPESLLERISRFKVLRRRISVLW